MAKESRARSQACRVGSTRVSLQNDPRNEGRPLALLRTDRWQSVRYSSLAGDKSAGGCVAGGSELTFQYEHVFCHLRRSWKVPAPSFYLTMYGVRLLLPRMTAKDHPIFGVGFEAP